ncbi:TetR/AcrR family transcriptional regulator [Promicromonospora thailandica]|uniref:Transcriptional regulator, TetR family n=1 Tax=Promicromonospora thailandica TaxID=765201 RepID=A0A9X2G246_9MICO|nr:TetR/AcrR family transcriptional regulator [Promicromonospora thailandica]MCP2264278.1 transcriptional regulator, TetR family [Promicromonospora thailandica]BFF21043.1 TetR/AcrR family transcriptional regulator [Promicromonospora thailandica]
MKLTPKGRATRQRIVEGAATYLRGTDPGTATLDDIRTVTRTSKGQIFHYFPGGKDELLLAVARHEADRVLLDQEPHLSRLDSWASWTDWRDSVLARYRSQGRRCPLAALMDQVTTTPGSVEVVTELLDQWQRRVAAGVVAMQEGGRVSTDLDPARVAAAFVAGIQGGVQVLRATGSTDHLEASMDLMIDYLRAA